MSINLNKMAYSGRIIIIILKILCGCCVCVYSNVTEHALSCLKVNGERSPTEVYNDFRSSVLQILSAHKSPAPVAVANGTVPVDNQGTGPPEVDVERPSSHRAIDLVPEPRAMNLVSEPETFPRTICVVGECYQENNINVVGLARNDERIVF